MPKLPLQVTAKVVDKMHFDHGLTRDQIAGLGDALADAVFVLKSDTQDGRFVVVTKTEQRGDPVIVAIAPDGVIEDWGRSNVIASAYGKSNFGRWLERQAEFGNVIASQKKAAIEWLSTRGLQLPKVLQVIRKSGTKDIVSEKENRSLVTDYQRAPIAQGVARLQESGTKDITPKSEDVNHQDLSSPFVYQGYEDQGEAPRIHIEARLKALLKRFDKKENAAALAGGVKKLMTDIHIARETRKSLRSGTPRARGADIVRERLLSAKRRGDIEPAAVDFALWLLAHNPNIAKDLGISIKKNPSDGSSGTYNPAGRIMTLFKESENVGTAAHEILHHTERMMPPEIQNGIRKAWESQYAKAFSEAEGERKAILGLVPVAAAGGMKAQAKITDAFRDGTLNYQADYQLVNPSEFWAVNATRILKENHDATSWQAKAKIWLKEMVEKVKALLGLPSDAPILKALKSVLAGGGNYQSKSVLSNTKTLFDGKDALPDTIMINGVERPTKNSNGKPIHPTEEGIRNFWKWFGDSKVVDGKGRPIAVTHDTDQNFDIFDVKKARQNADIPGFFFFPPGNEDAAYKTYGKNRISAYLSLKNPFVGEVDISMDGSRVKESLIKKGYDGIVSLEDDGSPAEYIAFEPKQIKSAAGNSGAFDGKNPSILFSRTKDQINEGLSRLPETMRRTRGSDQVKAIRDEIVNKPFRNIETGVAATVSGASFGKMMSASNVTRSVSSQAHMQALGNIDKLFSLATKVEERVGKKENDAQSIKAIHHFAVPMPFDGETLLVKIMAKEFSQVEFDARIYLVEALDIERTAEIGTPASKKGDLLSKESQYPHLPAGVSARLEEMIRAVNGDRTQKSDAALSRNKAGGVSVPTLKAMHKRVLAKNKNMPPVHLLGDPQDAPQDLRAFIEQAEAMDDVEGALFKGDIYLFASNLKSEARAEFVLATHEVTHFGLRATFGKKLDAVLHNIWFHNTHIRKEASRIQKRFGLESYLEATEEVLAEMPTAELVKLKGFKRLVQFLRDFFAEKGFTKLAASLNDLLTKDMTQDEKAAQLVADVLNQARGFVKNKRRTARGNQAMTDTVLASGEALSREKLLKETVVSPTQSALFSRGEWRTGDIGTEARADAIIQDAVTTFKPLEAIVKVPTKILRLDKGTTWLYEKSGDLLEKLVPETVKAGVISDYGIPEAVIDRRVAMRGAMKNQVRIAGALIDKLATLTRQESRVAYEWMNNSDPQALAYFEKQLPPESVKVMTEVKAMIDALSKEAVTLGQLDQRTYEAHKFEYLRRSYEKYTTELTKGEARDRSHAISILGDQYKGRGMVDRVALSEVTGKPKEGDQVIRLEHKGKGAKREVAYVLSSSAIPEHLAHFEHKGTWDVRSVEDGKVTLWRDFTKEERVAMGEIDEARYAIAKTLHGMIHDVETGKHLAWIAKTYGIKNPAAVPGNIVESSERMRDTFKKGDWVKVPDTFIRDTSVKKYGALADVHIPAPIWNEVRQIVNRRYEPLGKMYAKILSLWKTSKTALSPAVHMNNIMSNFIMADWHDVGVGHTLKALRILLAASDKDGKYVLGKIGNAAKGAGIVDREAAKVILDRFSDSGGDVGTWAVTELQKEQIAPLLRQTCPSFRALMLLAT